MEKLGIFFSNRTADKGIVSSLQSALADVLPNLPFRDLSQELPSTDDWQRHAEPLIGDADLVVCIVGSTTFDSAPIEWELREAHRKRKPIIVSRLSPEHKLPDCCGELGLRPVEWETGAVAGLIGEALVHRILFGAQEERGGTLDLDLVWNQYNLMTQSWEALIARRQTVNTLYISATAALLVSIGALIATVNGATQLTGVASVAMMACLGVAMSYNWRKTIVSYGLLSNAKAKVVGALEAHLPARLFDAEWSILEARRYKSTTQADTQTAQFFMLLFAAIALLAFGLSIERIFAG